MDSHSDILRPLSEDEFQELLQLYREKYGEQNTHYLLMYNQNKWNQQLKNLNCKVKTSEADEWLSFRKDFYTYRDGDFRKYGTYVSLHYDIVSMDMCIQMFFVNLKQISNLFADAKCLISFVGAKSDGNIEMLA